MKSVVLRLIFLTGFFLVFLLPHFQLFKTREVSANSERYLSDYSPRVLAIGYNPSDGQRNIVQTYFQNVLGGQSVSNFEDSVFNTTIQDFRELSNNRINFQIVHKITISTFPTYPDGSTYNIDTFQQCVYGQPNFNPTLCDSRKFTFNYTNWVQSNNICQIAEQYNADEIWILSPAYLMAWENFMIGPTNGFNVNGSAYKITGCNRHYIALSGTYDRPETILHDYAHRIEATFNYITTTWKSVDKQNYWERFAGVSRYSAPETPYPGLMCGNGHFPANAVNSYDYSSTNLHGFNCADWGNFPNFTGARNDINCSSWGCTDRGWQKYWMSALPHSAGEVTMYSASNRSFQLRKDWWWYILSAENTINLVQQINGNIDNIAPVISSSYTVASGNNQNPVYSFLSNEPGTAVLGGGCSVQNNFVNTELNTITLNFLPRGTYSTCNLRVRDFAGNLSNQITIPAFTITGWDSWDSRPGSTKMEIAQETYNLYLFQSIIGDSGNIYNRSSISGTSWSTWQDNGGETNGPVSLKTYAGSLYQAVSGKSNGSVYLRRYNTLGGWQAWQNLGLANITGKIVLAEYNYNLFVIVRDTRGNIFMKWMYQDNWSPWVNVPGNTNKDIAVNIYSGLMYLTVVGTSGNIYTRNFNGGSFSPWLISGLITNKEISSFEFGGNLYQYAVDLNGGIWGRSYVNGAWSQWAKEAGGAGGSVESIVYANSIYQFVQGNSGSIYFRYYDSTIPGWSSWKTYGGNTQDRLSVTSFGGMLILAVRGVSGGIYTRTYSAY